MMADGIWEMDDVIEDHLRIWQDNLLNKILGIFGSKLSSEY